MTVKLPEVKVTDLIHERKTITLTGAAALGLAGTVVPVFTVVGRVWVQLITAFCTTNLGEAVATATLSLGVTSDVDKFIAVTNSIDIDANDWWTQAAPAEVGAANALKATTSPTAAAQMDVLVSENIILNPLVQNTNAGVLVIDIWYHPITDDGAVS